MSTATGWEDTNHAALHAAIARVRGLLQSYADGIGSGSDSPAPCAQGEAASALDVACAVFALSGFERDLLALCAAAEMDAGVAALCATAHGDRARDYPTFGLALAALPGAHWSAVSPQAPLRGWRLVEPGEGPSLVQNRLRLDERVLHFLAGLDQLDERLACLSEEVPAPDALVGSQETLAAAMAEAWTDCPVRDLPVLQLTGPDAASRRTVAARACARVGLRLWSMGSDLIPGAPVELADLARLWEREAWLDRRGLLVECDELDGERARALVARFADRMRGPLVLSCRERAAAGLRPVVRFELLRATATEQRQSWLGLLGEEAAARLDGAVDRLASQFSLSQPGIASAATTALRGRDGDLESALWRCCLEHSRPHLDGLAERIVPAATWDDLVLPEAQLRTLREIAVHGRRRAQVYEAWGFGGAGGRGVGVSVLFDGDSGTGKTLAAEVVAGELRLELQRIDLSQVVSKYIGETEKNLRRVFDAAEEGGVVLLFDEADAIFGRRSEVRDSHDRYANIEVSYLLQRMESYRGIAILTTNFRSAVNSAFIRRLRFVVHFPFPDEALRAQIWRRTLPPQLPTEGVDFGLLARLSVPGGSIRNIALHAAFLAADRGGAVTMDHLLAAARSEYAKLERPLVDAEVAGWR